MYRTCIAVVDATRARLFTYERSVEPSGVVERFTEHLDLVNPARRRRASELVSGARPGASPIGHLPYTLDDHRDAHISAIDGEFARSIANELSALVKAAPRTQQIVVCASPRMLGELRAVMRDLPIALDEVPRNLVKLSPSQLRDQLASYSLLPERPRLALA